MIHRLLIFILMVYSLMFFWGTQSFPANVQGAGSYAYAFEVDLDVPKGEVSFPKILNKPFIVTETAFEKKEVTEEEEIPFETEYKDDPDLEYGKEEVLEPGEAGKKIYNYLITHWGDLEIDRVLLSSETVSPKTEIISLGKKIVWKKLSTPDLGEIKYWRKMTVWATKYDSTCLGCNNTTALGAPVKQGVCAVDPKTISMYTHFYVPGYGKCQALDVGGAIKGEKIDLAYEDASTAPWGAQYVDIYLMDNQPE